MTRRNHRQLLVAASVLGVVLVLAVAVLVRGLGGGNEPVPPAATGKAPPSQSAERFLDSVGVNVHVTYLDTSYARIDDWLARLRELGVHHVRDGLVLGSTASTQRLRALAAAGMRLTLITALGDDPNKQISYAASTFGRSVEAVEAPNEVDAMGPSDWAERLRSFLPRLRAAVDADGPPSRTIIGPSFVHAESWKQVGALAGTWNVANLHPYPGGQEPSANLGQQVALAREQRRDQPIEVTETGYHNALRGNTGQPPVSEAAAGAYMPRLALAYFASGIERTFIYELADEKPDPGLGQPEQHFGLLRADLTPKPAFLALRNLLQTVRTSDGAGEPRDVRVSAAPDVRTLLLQRRDGSSVLALWRSASVWDVDARAPSVATPVPATVRFGKRAKDVAVSRPTVRAEPLSRRRDAAELRVPVAGDVVLVSYR
ncbi:MAG TPA: hypothetical protein VF257_16400 [Solirubrobacteraceae bacterium]